MNNQQLAEKLKTAQALSQQGRHAESEALLQDILRAAPSCGPALYRLGIFAAARGDTPQAGDYFARALAQAPDAPEILLSLAAIRHEQGETAEAMTLAARVEKNTTAVLTLHRLGVFYRQAGARDAAEAVFKRILQQQENYIPAYYGLHSIGRLKRDSESFAVLQRLAGAGAPLSPDDRVGAAFSLGRGYLDAGEDDAAFAQFAEGNRIKKTLLPPYDAARFDAYIDNIIRLFDAAAIARLQDAGPKNDRPVFIVGMPRSGSTLADQILTSHPAVSSVGESSFLRRAIPVYQNAELPGLFARNQPSVTAPFMAALDAPLARGIGEKYLALTEHAGRGVSRLVDKMLFNYLWCGLIHCALPHAKIIHCTRDPRDIALSLWQLTFTDGMQWTYDLADIAHYYLSYKKLMAHWHSLLPGHIHEVNYEHMVGAQEDESRKLLAHCNLGWDDRVLRFHEADRAVKTASHAQVRQPIYSGSIGKWKKYEKYLAPFLAVLDKQG